jgi:two-component system sensor histidine kinase KdpD
MADHGITSTWETRERVVVALTGAPGGDQLIRRAARMAIRAKGDLLGVHVIPDDGLTRPPSELLEKHKALLLEMGGTFHQVTGTDVPAALVDFAKSEHATQLVMGTSRRSRWTELTRGSIVNRVLRLASPMDVHVIHTSIEDEGRRRLSLPRVHLISSRTRRTVVAALALAAVGLPLLTTLLVAHRHSVSAGEGLLVYLGLVVACGLVGGILPALVTLVASGLVDDWYLVRPYGSLTVERGAELAYLFVFLLVGGGVSVVIELLAHRRDEVARATFEADALLSLAERLAGGDPAQAIVEQIQRVFGLDAVTLMTADGRTEATAGVPIDAPECERLPVTDHVLVLSGRALPAADRRLLAAFVAHLDAVVRIARLEDRAETVAELAQANDLRTALLAAVSHDLRTPLASIKAAATSLLQGDVSWSDQQTTEFLRTIDAEADRLNGLVDNLLDMSRLQTGALQLRLGPVGLDEVVPAALASLSRHTDQVVIDVPETLPRVQADPALLERAVANIIDNAVSNSPEDTRVRVEAGEVAGRVDLRIVDRGPGIAERDREKVFLPFQRLGDGGHASGVGLGLAVAKGFVEAMGGELSIDDTPGGGLTMVVSLPAVHAQQPLPPEADADAPSSSASVT